MALDGTHTFDSQDLVNACRCVPCSCSRVGQHRTKSSIITSFTSACMHPPPQLDQLPQVLRNSWSTIVSTCSCGTSAMVAPFAGIQDPPYRGVINLDVRDLCYDPRGWWKHAAAFDAKPSLPNDWLHRSSRRSSADGSPCGAMDNGELS